MRANGVGRTVGLISACAATVLAGAADGQVTLSQIRRDPTPRASPPAPPPAAPTPPAAAPASPPAAPTAPPYVPPASTASAQGETLPAGTRLYLSLDEKVTSSHGDGGVGAIVRCHVWRDVEYQGVMFIKGDSPATCRIDKVSHASMGGFKGKLSIGGVDVHAVDGQTVSLAGGYNKEGGGAAPVVWTVGLLVFWPALLISGSNAVMPPGAVFDVSTVNDLHLATQPALAARATQTIDLRGMGDALSAEFMLDDFIAQPKHEVMRIKLAKDAALPAALFIDNVNGAPVEAIPVDVKDVAVRDGSASGVAEVQTKLLAKHFAPGINRFELAYKQGGERKATEVILNVQM
jgi:hypothetical protein